MGTKKSLPRRKEKKWHKSLMLRNIHCTCNEFLKNQRAKKLLNKRLLDSVILKKLNNVKEHEKRQKLAKLKKEQKKQAAGNKSTKKQPAKKKSKKKQTKKKQSKKKSKKKVVKAETKKKQ